MPPSLPFSSHLLLFSSAKLTFCFYGEMIDLVASLFFSPYLQLNARFTSVERHRVSQSFRRLNLREYNWNASHKRKEWEKVWRFNCQSSTLMTFQHPSLPRLSLLSYPVCLVLLASCGCLRSNFKVLSSVLFILQFPMSSFSDFVVKEVTYIL